MRYILENALIKAEIESFGAELKSVIRKADGREYMWQADPKFWGRTSPVLFPFVGSLKNKEYKLNGKAYPMGQHGFARDMEFELFSQTSEEIWFRLVSTPETIKKFPYEFILKIGYVLDENTIQVKWCVENPSDDELLFSIGAHPAFLCPIHGETYENGDANKSGYKISFKGLTEVHHYGNANASGLASPSEDIVLPLENECATITADFFDRCTYFVDGKQTDEVGILDPEGNQYITMTFDMPLFALWSPEGKNAPFLCIEPWCGRCDAEDFEGELSERAHQNRLEGKAKFETGYCVKFS